jgi:hypothetical protein
LGICVTLGESVGHCWALHLQDIVGVIMHDRALHDSQPKKEKWASKYLLSGDRRACSLSPLLPVPDSGEYLEIEWEWRAEEDKLKKFG